MTCNELWAKIRPIMATATERYQPEIDKMLELASKFDAGGKQSEDLFYWDQSSPRGYSAGIDLRLRYLNPVEAAVLVFKGVIEIKDGLHLVLSKSHTDAYRALINFYPLHPKYGSTIHLNQLPFAGSFIYHGLYQIRAMNKFGLFTKKS